MTAVVERLEKDGYSPFTELSMDDGAWEIEVYKDEVPYELTVDPDSGKILSEHRDDSEARPPQDAKPLSEILQLLAKAGYDDIDDASSNADIGNSKSIARMASMRFMSIR
jgi:hypothetical protein